MEKATVRQAVPLQPMEDNGGADIHLQPVEDPTPEQMEAPEGGCDPVGSPCWSRVLAGPVDPWREKPTPEQDSQVIIWKLALQPIGNAKTVMEHGIIPFQVHNSANFVKLQEIWLQRYYGWL
ncbi:AN1-type zinc finger protein 5-like [Grus japonensis]|uniref:AN1-type zinc finger protein 5-like n=1 Tax=Grus japonensis TaxID=30415 RepID=A0ABC9W386_GRUJA